MTRTPIQIVNYDKDHNNNNSTFSDSNFLVLSGPCVYHHLLFNSPFSNACKWSKVKQFLYFPDDINHIVLLYEYTSI